MILIVAPESDLHAQRVAQEIAVLGEAVRIVDWNGAAKRLHASMSLDRGSVNSYIRETSDGFELALRDVSAVWNRRPIFPSLDEEVLNDEYRRFALREWQDLVEGMIQSLESSAKVVSPSSAQRAATKPAQLAAARRQGLLVPDTLITSDAGKAAEFIGAHAGRVVHKAMTGPRNMFLETRLWQDSNRSDLKYLHLAPTIFQELIEGANDIRVTVIGEEVYAASIDSSQSRSGLDSRLNMDAPVRSFELAETIKCQLRALMHALGLSFSAIDLKMATDGELYFLELNPQGQFLYIEILTEQPISAAVARFLVSGPIRV
jgi:RimK-like ATP-grasp domain